MAAITSVQFLVAKLNIYSQNDPGRVKRAEAGLHDREENNLSERYVVRLDRSGTVSYKLAKWCGSCNAGACPTGSAFK